MGRRIRRKRVKKEGSKIISWNCTGLRKKEGDFWKYLKKFIVVALIETWMVGKEGDHEKIEKIMEGYRIEFKKAKREGTRE